MPLIIALVQYLLVLLSVYGLAFTMAYLHGPFGWFGTLRERAKARYKAGHWIPVGLGCPICLTFWLAPLPMLWVSWPPAFLAVAAWWAWWLAGWFASVGIVAKLAQ